MSRLTSQAWMYVDIVRRLSELEKTLSPTLIKQYNASLDEFEKRMFAVIGKVQIERE